jgi:hypothetical protein
MSMPRSWVLEIHRRLTVRYGHAFYAQWRDLDADDVVSDWADTLDGITARMVKHALSVLPERAMNASQFRLICLSAPLESGQAYLPYAPAHITQEQREVLRIAAEALASVNQLSPGRLCMQRLQTFESRTGQKLGVAQRFQLDALERVYGKPAETTEV